MDDEHDSQELKAVETDPTNRYTRVSVSMVSSMNRIAYCIICILNTSWNSIVCIREVGGVSVLVLVMLVPCSMR